MFGGRDHARELSASWLSRNPGGVALADGGRLVGFGERPADVLAELDALCAERRVLCEDVALGGSVGSRVVGFANGN